MGVIGEKAGGGAGEGSGAGAGSGGGESDRFSDAEEESWHSPYGSRREDADGGGGSDPDLGGSRSGRRLSTSFSSSSVSACCSDVDLEAGGGAGPEIKVHLAKVEKDCRICHLGLESTSHESGAPIELGCSCKDDLAAAHKQCAEAWFKIKGNKTCEICGSVARNVIGNNETETMVEQWNETNNPAPPPSQETRSFWRGHRFLNFLLSCMVFAFVISWLFHFNVPS